MIHKVLVCEKISDSAIEYLRTNSIQIKFGSGLDEKTILKDILDCDAVIVRTIKITKEIIVGNPQLKIISKHGTGCDSIDCIAAKNHGVMVTYTPGANAVSVAEHTIGLILECARRIRLSSLQYMNGEYSIKDSLGLIELHNKTIGLIGCGNIAKKVAKIANNGFGMNIIAYDPYIDKSAVPGFVEIVDDINILLENSDFVSIHTPLNNENIGFINSSVFNRMKPTSYLINTARGELVNTNDLSMALADGKFAGAALDVTAPEPLPQTHPLFMMDNVIITPHCGALSQEAIERMGIQTAKNIVDFFNGKTPEFIYSM